MLKLKLKMSMRLSTKLWWRAWLVNEDLHFVKGLQKSVDNFFSYRRGIENDVEAFIDARLNYLKGKCNMRDVAEAKRVFQGEAYYVLLCHAAVSPVCAPAAQTGFCVRSTWFISMAEN